MSVPPLPLLLTAAAAGLGIAALVRRRYRRLRRYRAWRRNEVFWSIGYQRSHDPFEWNPAAAKLFTRDQVGPWARTLADPFLIRRDGSLYLFFEVQNRSESRASIGLAVHDPARDAWRFEGVVLDEPFHLSYPCVFAVGDDVYMTPETKQARSVRLYKAVEFPRRWQLEKVLLENTKLVDSSVVHWQDRYYLFASRKRSLHLFHADSLLGEWKAHPRSPVRRFNHSRGAGRILRHGGELYRFAQEQARGYGSGVHVFRILELSPKRYAERAVSATPLLQPFGDGWASWAMHHIDLVQLGPNDYFAVFDGAGVVRE